MNIKISKTLTTALCAALLFCSCGSGAAGGDTDASPAEGGAGNSADNDAAETVSVPDDSFITAAETAKKMGIGWNLGNTMEAYDATNCEKITYEWIPTKGANTPSDYETCWGAPVTTQEMIDSVKAAGFNTVRIPVFWGNMMENDGTWTINKDYIDRVGEIVDYCINDDLYVVVNIHHFDEFIIRRNEVDKSKEIFNTLWTQIAEHFRDYPANLVFEGFNEYLGGSHFDEDGDLVDQPKDQAYIEVNTLNQTFVDAVRATGGNNAERVLIVSGYWTNIDNTTSPEFVMPTDTAADKLMVSVHYVDNACYWSNQIGSQWWLDYIDGQIELLDGAFTEKGIPVFLGETTSGYPDSNIADGALHTGSAECMEIVLDKLTDHGFVPVLWDIPENFFLRNEGKIAKEEDAEVITKIAAKVAQ